MNPDDFQNLDRVIHERARLAIMSSLAGTARMSFTELRDLLGMTDGNLITHLRTLADAGYVEEEPGPANRRSSTMYLLTESGREAFAGYLKILEGIVKQARSGERLRT